MGMNSGERICFHSTGSSVSGTENILSIALRCFVYSLLLYDLARTVDLNLDALGLL